MPSDEKLSRRALLAGAALTVGGSLIRKLPLAASAPGTPAPLLPDDPSAQPGAPTSPLGARSPYETPARAPVGVLTGASLTPLQELTGTITPSDLLFERHHSGVPAIDPRRYKLLLHGLVNRPTALTLEDLKRLPSVSRIYFLECSGNGRAAFRDPRPEMTAQMVDGVMGNGEWTGVPLAVLLREAGIRHAARWILAEGGDSAKVSRSIPLEKAVDDAMVAYAFNGEALRPANGYPARLFLPGYEGSMSIKWLRRLKLVDQPNMTRDETARYTDPLADGTARQFSFVMDVKSIVTHPSHPARLERGWQEISGLAWSGRGRIARVELSADGGRSWMGAELQEPVLSRAQVRFRRMWNWNGEPTVLLSRAVDETGAVQPTRAEFEAKRGKGTDYHFNYIRGWEVRSDGRVMFAVGA